MQAFRANFSATESGRRPLLRCWSHQDCRGCLADDECSWCPFVWRTVPAHHVRIVYILTSGPPTHRPGRASPTHTRYRCWPRPTTPMCALIPPSSGSCAHGHLAAACRRRRASPPLSPSWPHCCSSPGPSSTSSPSADGDDTRRRSLNGTRVSTLPGELAGCRRIPASNSRCSVNRPGAELLATATAKSGLQSVTQN